MKKLDILALTASKNIAEELDKNELCHIADRVMANYEADEKSRSKYMATIDEAMKIAKQEMEPQEGLAIKANVKYPLMTIAAIQFAARTYPEQVRNGKTVECEIFGEDPEGLKAARSKRCSEHMSSQMLSSPTWAREQDKLLHTYSITGTAFKKVYFDEIEKCNCSDLCLPEDIIIHNSVKSLKSARSVTHVLHYYMNDIVSRIKYGIYCDITDKLIPKEINKKQVNLEDNDKLHTILEQHTFLDLDKDGYEEPYIVTIHKETCEILRIYHRWDLENVYMLPGSEVIYKIDPVQYFVDYHFIPNPDGSYYSIGFGQLLLPLNETLNSSINQLLDAGTLSNRQSGFIGQGFKMKKGSLYLSPGEWKSVPVMGEDIKNNIFPMPVREPSDVMLKLIGIMTDAGKQLTSISDIMQGNEHAQNAPATTVLALLEQGGKVFSSIQKRLYTSMSDEFDKWFRLNRLYLKDSVEYKRIVKAVNIQPDDYTDQDMSVRPVSDPSMSSDAQRLARAKAMLDIVPMLQPQGQEEVLRNWLESLQTPEALILKILPQNSPNAPSPAQHAQQLELAEQQQKAAQAASELRLKAEIATIQEAQAKSQAMLNEQLSRESQARILKMKDDAITAYDALQIQSFNKNTELSIKAVQKMDDLAAAEEQSSSGA